MSQCDLLMMSVGPVLAIGLALRKAGLYLKDTDVVERNETFDPLDSYVGKSMGFKEKLLCMHEPWLSLYRQSDLLRHLIHELEHHLAWEVASSRM